MAEMRVGLSSRARKILDRQLKTGRFTSAGDALSHGLLILERRDEIRASLGSGFPVLGSMPDGDIMALAFLVMMEAAESAQEDLRAIMAGVKAINNAKAALRDLISRIGHDIAENSRRKNGKPPLSYRPGGVGSEAGYHRLRLPQLDPRMPGGLRRVPTDMHKGRIGDVGALRAIRDDLKTQLDTMSEMGEMELLRLQMAMDRVSKYMTALSNILKKISDTDSAIVANLK